MIYQSNSKSTLEDEIGFWLFGSIYLQSKVGKYVQKEKFKPFLFFYFRVENILKIIIQIKLFCRYSYPYLGKSLRILIHIFVYYFSWKNKTFCQIISKFYPCWIWIKNWFTLYQKKKGSTPFFNMRPYCFDNPTLYLRAQMSSPKNIETRKKRKIRYASIDMRVKQNKNTIG